MTDAIGPIFSGGGFETIELTENGEGYTILYLPDKNNQKLQQEGKPPVYYWVSSQVRLARHAENGDFKFSLTHYSGDPNPTDNEGIGVGGMISFTTTIAYPPSVLKGSQEKLLERFKGSDKQYWGWTTSATPEFRIVPITSNATSILGNENGWRLDGEGPGNVTGGENAFFGMLDALHSELLWSGFHGGTSPIAIQQILQIPVWTEKLNLKITGKWSRIYNHFSTHLSAGGWYWSVDIQRVFNDLRVSGGIKVELQVDGTMPGADEMQKLMEQHQELILKQFMDQASKIIFEPAPPKAESAKATRGRNFWGFGGGFALKQVWDQTQVDLDYEETIEFRYNKEFPISSSLEGLRTIIQTNPDEEKKYFIRNYLDLVKLVPIIVKPVINWPQPENHFAGEPVAFASVQIGYPMEEGSIHWEPQVFEKGGSTSWEPQIVRKRKTDVLNPPQNWEPDKIFIKRKLHLVESPSADEFQMIFVEKNDVDLDPGDQGTLTNEQTFDVRADHVGMLEVGPIVLGVEIPGPTWMIEVEFQALGNTHDGNERPVTKMMWKYESKDQTGYWKIYTGQLDYKPEFKYRVRVIEKGVLGEASGSEWQGEWERCVGNGPLVIKVPNRLPIPV
ncbi:hypothetical protein [Paenibacillus sp. FSL P2-0173]|uniref:hypothetical protein n=1 Tax=Paenibacillus sp. FSL P2-0173 TaxID=2921627 RepID=UPI0030F51B4C